ncbi:MULTISPECIES: ATP-binding protein [Massilia]|uniref:histidine kinase n=1 Tax=Massilia timonae TaxID=47229 RepID=A0A1S2N4Z9_9BURK|nr:MULTISPECIES: ATP-binding protein [Massilia]OIJ39963.1 his Kinase A domain protein [Massilia timonae]
MRPASGARWSLRKTLLALLLGLTVALWAGSAAIVYVEAEQESHELFDHSLSETANLLLSLVENELREHGYIKLPVQVHPNPDRYLMFQVFDARGRLMYRNAGAPAATLAAAPPDGFSWSTLQGQRWRVYALRDRERTLRLVVAEPNTHREDISTRFFYKVLAFGSVLVALAAAAIWWSVHRVFRVLQASADEVAARTPNDLAQVKLDGIPSEAFPLMQAINRLFGRVRHAIEHEQRFTADAAHELRTPLAAIKTNLQVLQRARNEAERAEFIGALGVSVDRASRLVDQLLTLAKLDPDGGAAPALRPGDIATLLREDADDWQVAGAARGHVVTFKIAPAPCLLEPDSLRMLVRNLVDNALRYSPAPGKIAIACGQEHGQTYLQIKDGGPGIPEAQRDRVFERFVRLAGSHQPGSGLGLSIVRRIADLHGAELRLTSGFAPAGLTVDLVFVPDAATQDVKQQIAA